MFQQSHVEVFCVGSAMLIHGQIGNPFYVLVAGLVKVTQAAEDGHEKQLVEIGPGAYFGELGVLKDQPRAATVIAETKVEALCIEANVFKR